MSAPNTDPKKQERQHRPALTGLRLTIIVAVVALVAILSIAFFGGEAPEGADTRIDGRTGEQLEATD